MILTDYFKSNHDMTWDYAKQCGVEHGVIRLPEDAEFDITDFSHWEKVNKKFIDLGIKPLVIEPMPNELHDHIKIGDEMSGCTDFTPKWAALFCRLFFLPILGKTKAINSGVWGRAPITQFVFHQNVLQKTS